MKYPVYIPSRARSHINGTIELLLSAGILPKVVLSVADLPDYRNRWPQLEYIIQPPLQAGMAHIRNLCKWHSSNNGDNYHWQIDDDCNSFVTRFQGEKQKRIPFPEAAARVELLTLLYSNIGLAALQQNVWPPRCSVILNRQASNCVLVRNNTAASYRLPVWEDLDYAIQVLTEGYCTLIADRIRYCTGKSGLFAERKVTGGLPYNEIDRDDCAMRFIKFHPEYSFKPDCHGVKQLRSVRFFQKFTQRLIPYDYHKNPPAD